MIASDIKKYELEITANCNAQCPLCARTEMGMPLRGNAEISLQDIMRIFKTEQSIEGKEFKLCGVLGDPIVHPECLEICEWLGEKGGNVIISTNGGYNTPDWWTRLAKVKNLKVDFSVDGFENTNHIYRVNVKWDILVRNMKAFAQAGGNANWVFIPFGHNEDDYEPAKQLAKELGMRFVRRTSGRNELANTTHKSKKMTKEVKLEGSKKIPHNDLTELKKVIDIKSYNKKKVDEVVPTVDCQHFNEPELYISADRTVWPCCYLYDESKQSYKRVIPSEDKDFNSLDRHTIEEILQTELYKTLNQRWYASHDNHLRRCIRSCGLKGVYKNKKEYA